MKFNPLSRALALMFCLGLLNMPALSAGVARKPDGVPGVDYQKDKIIVSVKRGVALEPHDFSRGGPVSTGYPSLDRLIIQEKVTKIEPFYPGKLSKEPLKDVLGRMFILTIGEDGDLESALGAFGSDPNLEYADPWMIYHVDYTPNDPLISSWYHLNRIEASVAWDYIRGDSTNRTIIGIVDCGVYFDHPDLEPNMWINGPEDIDGDGRFTEADLDGIDDDGNGYTDDVVGWDFGVYQGDPDPSEPIPWHGTHVAGCATMACDNGYGGAAVGWGARIMAVKCATDDDPNSIPFGFVGIGYAAENGAKVINLSWGRAGSPYPSEQDVINAAHAVGAAVVAAAGNENSSARHYPAAYNNVVAVAATDQNDVRAYFSNYGTWVDISAPGVGIFSTWDHDSFSSLDGTSMSSPITSGSLALIRSGDQSLGPDEATRFLQDYADSIYHLNPSYRGMLGSGRVNIGAAIGRDRFPRLSIVGSTVSLTEDDGDGRLNPSERFNLVIRVRNLWVEAPGVTGMLRSDSEFTVLDSIADFGTIPGNGGEGDNSSSPFDVRVNPDAHIRSHDFTLLLTTNTGLTFIRTLQVPITLELAGFPGNIPGNIDSSPLIFDFDNDGSKEIVISAGDRNYYSFESNGTMTPNWPQLVSHDPLGGCAAGDLDNNGSYELVGMSRDGNMYAWESNGALLAGFPHSCGSAIFSTPVLGDIDGNGDLEIIIGGFTSKKMYVLNHDGTDFPGWPFQGQGNIFGAAALGDIDNDGFPEIVYGDFDSTLHVLNSDLTEVPGFPVRLSGMMKVAAGLADIDGDDHINIIVGTNSGDIYALDCNGTVMPGWPFNPGQQPPVGYSPPSLSDIDYDGHLEILAGGNNSRIYVLNANGTAQSGFPVETGGNISGSPVVGDIDGDGSLDIAFGATDGYIYALDHNGLPLRNFPIPSIANGQITGSAGLADLDGDGDCDIVVGVRTSGNNLEVIDYKEHLPVENFTWPFFGKDLHRTSYYGPFVTGIDERADVPVSFQLSQNYPNPFNVRTLIQFSLPEAGMVELTVYDLLGRRVKTLYSGFLPAGAHNMIWDGTGQNGAVTASGIYFYRLDAAGTTLTKRMTLMK